MCIRDSSKSNYFIDPHTATAVEGLLSSKISGENILTFATAHPGKFPDAYHDIDGFTDMIPSDLISIFEKEESFIKLNNNYEEISNFISSNYKN